MAATPSSMKVSTVDSCECDRERRILAGADEMQLRARARGYEADEPI